MGRARMSRRKVLAIGLDAAGPDEVAELISRGELPALAALAQDNAWLRLESTAVLGSGSVWPTFVTGRPPEDHRRIYGYTSWDAARMRMMAQDVTGTRPFWLDAD